MSVGKVILVCAKWLIGSPRYIPRLVTVETARNLLSKLTPAVEPGLGPKQLLADVSVIVQTDAGTGIQRVVRELLRQLIARPPSGYVVRPVFATEWRGFRYADQYYEVLTGRELDAEARGKVVVRAGDIFLGMDLAARTLPLYPLSLARWKMSGVKLYFLVYDLLPALHPDWFTSSGVKTYREWIRTLAIFADGAVCISRSVANELKQWLAETYGKTVGQSISTTWFRLSGEIFCGTSDPKKLEKETARLLEDIGKRPSVLMVGTIEPRKGYDQALTAFESLWREGRDVTLIIVGRVGWKVEELVHRLRKHPEADNRLIWLEGASDEILCCLYGAVDGLLMTSKGEGFGLPIAEAAQYGTPMLVRDIPTFREVAGEHVHYFCGTSAEGLAVEIRTWLDMIHQGHARVSISIGHLKWRESAEQLTRCLDVKPVTGYKAATT